MNNVKVPKLKGGIQSEIAILGTNRKTNANIWVEVAVFTNPGQLSHKAVRLKETVDLYLGEFVRKDKQKKVFQYFGNDYEKWFVYGKLALTRGEIEEFSVEMEKNGVTTIYFGDIYEDMRKLKQHYLHSTRPYVNLFKAFHREFGKRS